ncbi:MAG TPA: peptide-methionine (S)-S-oxide reductase MsrA [Sandaracinaceae bacterium LLY-WYZ-13_1]|nr:peptide-methionine (S)-S-oxide reductase MsrA [Sandaracinaceae bacterium LLY-WYZ-13_1]
MLRRLATVIPVFVWVLACSSSSQGQSTARAPDLREGQAEAIFAGGCFWCMEGPFERIDGVSSVTSGYTGGSVEGPSYEQVSRGGTGHAEAVRVVYDPDRVDYARLLEVYWHNVDPTQSDGQFCDHGDQYRTAIFVVNDEQRRLAEASKRRVREELGRRVVTEIVDAEPFWVAEDYHQDYYRTHPTRYRRYRAGCGRDRRLRELWGEDAAH